jgi:hypothetical protein
MSTFPWGPAQIVVAALFGVAVLTLVILVFRWLPGRSGYVEVTGPPPPATLQRVDDAGTLTQRSGEAGR